MWSKTVIFLLSAVFLGCTPIPEGQGLHDYYSQTNEDKEPAPQFEYIDLYKAKPLIKDLPLEGVDEGTKVDIWVKGISMVPKFSEVYEKAVQSTFRDPRCNKMPCFPAKGHCYPRFRDFLGYEEKEIDLELKPLGVVVGNKELQVPLEVQEISDNGWARISLEVSAEMLEEGELSIMAPVKKKGPEIVTGMIDLGDRKRCEGIRYPDFKLTVSRVQKKIPVDPVDKYYVTVKLEKKIQ